MSEEQKDTDFVERLKQMRNDMKTTSLVGDTFNRLEEIQKKNEDLKEKIKIKDELIKRSEELLKKTLEAREKLRKENYDSLNRLQSDLGEKDEILKQKDKELYELRLKVENSLEEPDIKEKLISITDSAVNEALQLDLQNQIFALENNVKTLEFTIETLNLEIDKLKKELGEKEEASTIDYVIPVIEPELAEPEPAQPSNTLETLCQDLQTDLNRYKTIVATLKNENTTLKTSLESKGTPIVVDNTDELKNENLALKSQVSELTQKISELQKSLQNVPLESPKKEDSDIKIRALQEEIREKEEKIADLEASTTVQVIATPSGPVSGLVEDLQNQINKLKIVFMQKNQVINELKK